MRYKKIFNLKDKMAVVIGGGGLIGCEIVKALSSKFTLFCRTVENPYDGGFVAKKIVAVLKREIPKITDLKKKFYDNV